MFLAALGMLLRYIWTGFACYYSYPVSTKVEYISERRMEFPSVTICNYNFVRKSYLDTLDNQATEMVLDMLNPITTRQDLTDPGIIAQLKSVDMERVGAEAAHQKQDMFLECSFMGSNNTKCPCQFHEELFVSTKTQMGFCYTFHPNSYMEKYGALFTTRTGFAGGLFMLVDVGQYEYQIGSRAAGIKVCYIVLTSQHTRLLKCISFPINRKRKWECRIFDAVHKYLEVTKRFC